MIVKGPIKPYNSIGQVEQQAALAAMDGPLSGYLAGKERGGPHVCALEDAWCETFGVKHAIACNSNTSGMMAAAFACGLGPRDKFLCPAVTMTATAAAPMFTGATPIFGDVDEHYFALREQADDIKAVFLTHLFGIAFDESWWTGWARQNDIRIIVDAAQSPFAKEARSDRYAGTIADIGVYSLNTHKPLNCGEGGICVTNDDELAARMRALVNHGEHVSNRIGLNLRLNEVSAAIALAQLRRGHQLVEGRREQAQSILDAIGDIPGLWKTRPYRDAIDVYYVIPFLVEKNRAEFCAALREEGVPIEEGYVEPLYRMSAFKRFARPCPVAEDLQDRRLLYLENCAFDFTKEQIKQVGEAFQKAAERWM